MRRRTVLAALGTAPVTLAGCVSVGSGGDCSFPDWEDDDPPETDRPDEILGPTCAHESRIIECSEGVLDSIEYETAEPVPYPDPPAAFTDGALVEYVETVERAYVTHDVVCRSRDSSSYVTDVFVSIHRSETLDLYDDRTAVFLVRSGGATSGVHEQGGPWDAGAPPPEGVVYAVEASGVDRVAFELEQVLQEGEDRRDPEAVDIATVKTTAPDPVEDGERVAAFE